MQKRALFGVIFRSAVMGATITAIAHLYHTLIHANSATAALTFLLIVMAAAAVWGLAEAMLASVWCVVYYFILLPAPSVSMRDPQNWVSWGAFIVTSFMVSELSARLKKRASEASQRQREIERLYALSCSLMPGDTANATAWIIPERVVGIFGCSGVAFFDSISGEICRAGAAADISDASLRRAAGVADAGTAAEYGAVVPVSLGATAIGSLGFAEATISRPAIYSIANLAALAMDRARKLEAAGQAEAARRHQELKSMLLDALAHEFQTPLTSIRTGIGAMLAESPNRDQREWLEIMDEESGRLSGMMAEAIQMARIEAGHVDLDKQTHTVEDLVYSALEQKMATGSHLEIDLPQGLPPVSVDAGLIRLVIRQLAANAMKYAQAGTPITVSARADGSGVVISVSDRGPGIPAEEQERIFEKFYRGKQGRGQLTGMGLGLPIARQVVEAHDGRVWVESRPGEGSTFSFTLPFAHEEVTA